LLLAEDVRSTQIESQVICSEPAEDQSCEQVVNNKRARFTPPLKLLVWQMLHAPKAQQDGAGDIPSDHMGEKGQNAITTPQYNCRMKS
jgi:hypothetical protein